MLNRIIKYFLENKLVTVLVLTGLVAWGIVTTPFGWQIGGLPSDPVPVDAIPDIGENQLIILTPWNGRSPQDISIYIIFNEVIEFYWSRSRILEKLSSLPSGLLPDGVQTVSATMIEMTNTFTPLGETIYVQHCPMADNNKGADWLSREKEIRNPYFGSSMLTCGEVTKEIK